MALPDGRPGSTLLWPPPEWQPDYLKMAEHAAWYSGSIQDLTRFYYGYASLNGEVRPGGFFDPAITGYPKGSFWRRMFFWARQAPEAITRQRVHVPLAAEIATTSADMLFSDPPNFVIAEAHRKTAAPGSKKTQDRLDALVDEDALIATCLEAAEICAALGGVFLRATWDREFCSDRPLLTAVHPDAAVPEFKWGYLEAVTFWRVVYADDKTVWRHLERHEPGAVLHGLYRGTATQLGETRPLTEMPATAQLASDEYDLTDGNRLETGIDDLTAVYVPNMRPNRANRYSDLGRSDYSGSEVLLDALDETATSLQREIRLGKARIVVPSQYLKSLGKGKGAMFDTEQEIYEKLEMHPQETNIEFYQAQIRTREHIETMDSLVERIVTTAGYSPSTFGLKGQATVERTATEVKAREHRSLSTRDKKIRYFSPALADVLEAMLALDNKFFGGPAVYRPRVDFPESMQESTLDTATAIELLSRAGAVSDETKVAMAHPSWTPDEMQAEVDRLKAAAATVPVVTTPKAPPPTGKPDPQNVPPVSPDPTDPVL